MAAILSALLQTPLPQLRHYRLLSRTHFAPALPLAGCYAAVDLAAQVTLCVTLQEHGGNLTADAIELQLKDNHNQMVPALSFSSRGREMTVSDYGLVPGPAGTQHHIWAIFVDDTAAKIQREATARILQPTGKAKAVRRCMQIHQSTILQIPSCIMHTCLADCSLGKGIVSHLPMHLHQAQWTGRFCCHVSNPSVLNGEVSYEIWHNVCRRKQCAQISSASGSGGV